MEATPSTIITVDNREHDLIALCTEQTVAIQVQSLPIGDVLIQHGEQTLVFERKTIADLAASIKDGRFKEQKQRLKSTYPFHRIMYLIEGSQNQWDNCDTRYHIPTSTLTSALISSRYRDGFHVHHTKDLKETLLFLRDVAARMGEKTSLETECKEDYVASLKVKTTKKDNVTPEVCYLMQLGQLPGISITIAKDIVAVYPKMGSLLDALKENGEKALTEIKGLGPKRAKLFVEYLL